MSADRVAKTAHYLRAIWTDGAPQPLSELLISAHKQRKTVPDRRFDYSGGVISGAAYLVSEGMISVHVTHFVPGRATCMIPDGVGDAAVELTEQNPTRGHNFGGRDAFFLVSGDDVIVCNNDAHLNVMRTYVIEMLTATSAPDAVKELSILPVAAADKLRLIEEEGVQEINLSASLYDASYRYAKRKAKRRGPFENILGRAAFGITSVFTKDNDDDEAHAASQENVNVNVLIKFDRRKKGGELSQESLKDTARQLVEEEDGGFTIKTQRGTTMRSADTSIRTRLSLEPFGNSVSRRSAWKELRKFYEELHASGRLEE